jgi:hypothetical protein
MNRLIREFGDTFFFYYAFGRVGVADLGSRAADGASGLG